MPTVVITFNFPKTHSALFQLHSYPKVSLSLVNCYGIGIIWPTAKTLSGSYCRYYYDTSYSSPTILYDWENRSVIQFDAQKSHQNFYSFFDDSFWLKSKNKIKNRKEKNFDPPPKSSVLGITEVLFLLTFDFGPIYTYFDLIFFKS
jgi:hypothetical protein